MNGLPPLLPVPLHLACLDGWCETGGLAVREMIDPAAVRAAGDEAYRLTVAPGLATISARAPAGLRWGRATLAQLRCAARLPCLEIDDAPRFAQRGVMLDISRDRVPTMATLFDLVERMAAMKLNHLQLYVEHALAYAGHEDAWRAATPLTLEELSALDRFAAMHGVELNANQNCLGHFERWLAQPRYAPLGEMAHGRLLHGLHREPNTLCPLDARVLPLIEDLLAQQLPRCSGAFANIGCDEPWDLGLGRSAEACARFGRGAVFSQHVAAVAALARRLGKRPQFWCDPQPNEGDGLPADLVALVWGYEDDDVFQPRLDAHRAAGRSAWVAPGTSCWNSTTGRTWNRRGNLDRAAVASGADGLLGTVWGDHGHRQPWPVTLLGIADTAMAAWSGPGRYDDAAAGAHVFGSPALGAWLAQLGDVDIELCRDGPARVRNATALWRELHADVAGADSAEAWRVVGGRLADLRASLPGDVPEPLADECRLGLDVAAWTCDRAIARRGGAAAADLPDRLSAIVAEHRRLWLMRSRSGGLDDSARRYLALSCR